MQLLGPSASCAFYIAKQTTWRTPDNGCTALSWVRSKHELNPSCVTCEQLCRGLCSTAHRCYLPGPCSPQTRLAYRRPAVVIHMPAWGYDAVVACSLCMRNVKGSIPFDSSLDVLWVGKPCWMTANTSIYGTSHMGVFCRNKLPWLRWT